MGRIIGVINAIWARSGPRIYIHNIGVGTFLLRVVNQRTREYLLSRNVWNIAGFPMFVAPWSPEFSSDQLPLSSALVPVEFRKVPYLLFNKQSLSRIATTIGKPVSLAPETERKENFEVAKIYVRVDLTKKLPSKCDRCGKYGHDRFSCAVGEWQKTQDRDSKKRSSASPSRSRGAGGGTRKSRSRKRRSRSRKVSSSSTSSKNEVRNNTPRGVAIDNVALEVVETVTIGEPIKTDEVIMTLPVEAKMQQDTVKVRSAVPSMSAQSTGDGRIIYAIPANWKFFGNFEHHHLARLVVVWDPSVSLIVYQVSAQAVTYGVFIPSVMLSIRVTFIYRFNSLEERQSLWDELSVLNATTPVSRNLWAVVGDFNQILRASQYSNSLDMAIDDSGTDEINLALQDVELFEAQAKGLLFTWWNN
ncbi:unnamed protein product [Arabis nemorensis]|uniref:DUF4283 domain-containing protein n=1 Tax=Arabis nemorensis TaxID=586526 RepID=A0A565B1N3_9BRAS|nr:unnamed protein product [Arabis nemorensis]